MRFKHLYILLPLLWAATKSLAQSNTPNLSQTSPAGTNGATWTTPAEVNTSGDISYIRSFVPLVPITDTADVNSANQPGNIKQKTAYLDGFMRPFQTITRNAARVNDVARHLVDINFNYPSQDQRSYLPYSSGSSGLQSNAFQAQRSYYDNLYTTEGYTGFSKTENTSDASNRTVKSLAPGKSQIGQGNGIITRSISNASNEVFIWDWDESNGIPVASGYYAPLQLFGQQTVVPGSSGSSSEAPQSKIFKDKDGKLILKMVAAGTSGTVIIYEYTYYVYDKKGNLRCIITPKAFVNFQNHVGSVNDVANGLCFLYRYDAKGRLIAAQKPGENGFTYVVYDAKDRPVMRQTPNEALDHKWEITFYDGQNRIKATSIFSDNDNSWNQEEWQGELDAAVVNGASANTIPYYLATTAGENSYPDDNINNNEMMSYTYYDNYSIIDPNGDEWNNLNTQLAFSETVASQGAEVPEKSDNVYGAVTGSMVRILTANGASSSTTGEWRKSVIFYDHKGRVTFSGTQDLYQGNVIHFNLIGTQYDFAGRMRVNKHAWYNANSTDAVSGHTELNLYTYDAVSGALINTKHKVDDGAWNTISTCTYDELGRVKRKSLGNGGEVQDMSYNIRGQLTGINGKYAETGLKENYSRSFGESIKYDYGFTKNRLDGKMAGIVWRGSDVSRGLAYGYDYTQHQLLKSADFRYYYSSWSNYAMDYSVSNLSYDENGNILSMKQEGTQPGVGPVHMDDLTYNYPDNSNRLEAVTDGGVADYGAGDFQDNAGSYRYDNNGNLLNDENKGITNDIGYTFFNKPSYIYMANNTGFSYSYDAAGNKVQELMEQDPVDGTIRTDYIGNAVYENDVLKYILTAEGRTTFDAGRSSPFMEEYFVKDHLGNVRSTINAVSYMPRNYLADYEVASANLEHLIFDNIDELREIKPGGDENNSMAAKLNGGKSSSTVGSALLLHVMAGDKIDMKVNDFYDYYAANLDTPVNAEDMIANVITTLTGGYNGFEGEHHNTQLVGSVFGENNSGAYNDLLETLTDPDKPKAYLNYVMFDENMNIVPESSGAFQAQHEGGWGEIGTTEAMEIPVNGYIAIYLSNASLRDAYFDRMRVELIKGSLLEETHYYPHGLPITGLSSEDPGLMRQRRKYQSNEYIRSSGLNWMSFGARQYDPQIGRFLSVDPLAAFGGQDRYSPYAAMGNQPESSVDPNGLIPTRMTPGGTQFETYRNIDPTAGGFGSDWGMYGGAGSNYSGGGDEIWNDLCNFGGSTASRAAAAVAQQEKINSFNATLEGTGLQIGDDESWQDSRPKKKDGTTDGGQQKEQGTSNNNWTLSFTGEAHDETKNGKTRQMGTGKLTILDENGEIVASYDAISGDGINGLLPNGKYKGTKLTMNGGFPDETGLDYKIFLDPVGDLANGFKRSALRIHPTQHYWSGTLDGVKRYTTNPTDGCIGLVGNANAAPFLQYMQTYFQNHNSIYLNVNIINNANIKNQLGNKPHY